MIGIHQKAKMRMIYFYHVTSRFSHRSEHVAFARIEWFDDHHHIRCEVCGRIDDIELANTERLDELVVGGRGYEVHGYTLCFVGICGECAGNGKNHGEKRRG